MFVDDEHSSMENEHFTYLEIYNDVSVLVVLQLDTEQIVNWP